MLKAIIKGDKTENEKSNFCDLFSGLIYSYASIGGYGSFFLIYSLKTWY